MDIVSWPSIDISKRWVKCPVVLDHYVNHVSLHIINSFSKIAVPLPWEQVLIRKRDSDLFWDGKDVAGYTFVEMERFNEDKHFRYDSLKKRIEAGECIVTFQNNSATFCQPARYCVDDLPEDLISIDRLKINKFG